MRKTTLFLLISLFSFFRYGWAQCPAGDLIIQNQAQVNYFVDQCPDVDTLQGSLIIGDLNSDITDISGLQFLRVVEGGLTVQHNDSLQSLLGLDSIKAIGGRLDISQNQKLVSLTHLEGISTINGSISISQNNDLIDLDGLTHINTFDGDLIITDNAQLISLTGLANIQNANGSVRIHNNTLLPSLKGLRILKAIQGDLTIQSNDALKSVDGLDSLESIGNNCSITYNPSLADLDAFAKLTTIGADLYIGSNTSLSDCTGICDLLNKNGISGNISIGDNLSNCLNNSVLIPYCQALPTATVYHPSIDIYPNPAHNYLKINDVYNPTINQLVVYTLAGKKMLTQKNKNNLLDISHLSTGMYILAVHTNNLVYYQKFVVD